jgi:hypothetical protein
MNAANSQPNSFPPLPTYAALVVLGAALLINGISFAGSQLWVSPDASYYVELAGGLADRLDFRSQLFLIRPPGYPIFLAVLFRLFGDSSPTAIMVVQHLMVVGIVYLVTLIAWRITRQAWAAFLAGLMSACSLQLITYANLVMTEVPYTLATVWALYHLVAYHQSNGCRDLAVASLLIGVSYLFRPIGMVLLPVCVAVALFHTWVLRGGEAGGSGCREPVRVQPVFVSAFRRFGVSAFWAVAPALAVVLPCMSQNQLIHGGDLSTRCADLALYFRIVYMDKLDSRDSEALNDIRAVVTEARDKHLIADNADYRLWGPVWQAYEKTRGVGLADSSRIMGRAARDLINEHPLAVLDGTIRYSLWMILMPDGFYRFHPGGTPGIRSADGECRRDPNAAILAADTYEPMMRQWTKPYEHYLPLRAEPTTITPLWSGLARWFYTHVEKAPSILGVGDSPYEAFGWLCIAGMFAALFMPQRGCWLIIIAAIGLQIVVSAFLAGPTPRYAVPVRPLLLFFPTLPFVLAIAVAWKSLRNVGRLFSLSLGHPERTVLPLSS